MSIPDHARANFQTLLRAATSGDLALMECTRSRRARPAHCLAENVPECWVVASINLLPCGLG